MTFYDLEIETLSSGLKRRVKELGGGIRRIKYGDIIWGAHTSIDQLVIFGDLIDFIRTGIHVKDEAPEPPKQIFIVEL